MDKQTLKYSIIIPTFNRAMITFSCVTSLLHLLKDSKLSYEIIVVDDGSTDNTYELFSDLLSSHQTIRLIKSDKEKGKYRNPGFARNAGIKAAHGEYICFCDGDIIHLQDPLLPTNAIFEKNSACYVTGIHYRLMADKLDGPRGAGSDMPHGSWLAVKKDILITIGGYDQRFMRYGNEDNDIVQRFRRHGLTHVNASTIIAIHPDFDSGRVKNKLDDLNRDLQMEIQRDTSVVRNNGVNWGIYSESVFSKEDTKDLNEIESESNINGQQISDDISAINDALTMITGKISTIDRTFSLVNNIHRGVVSLEEPLFKRKKHSPSGKEIFDLCNIYLKKSIETDFEELLSNHESAKKISSASAGKVDTVVLSQIHRQRNVGQYLDAAYERLNVGGELIVLCPAFSNNVGSGNLSGPWNAGHLLYNLVVAGFDCKKAKVSTFESEIQICAHKTYRKASTFVLNELSDFFPIEIYQHFNGNIKEANWK